MSLHQFVRTSFVDFTYLSNQDRSLTVFYRWGNLREFCSVKGFIRVGSRVWGKALNGDFYKGVVTGLGEMLHIKFDNGDTIAHDRTDTECVVFDQVPEISDLEVGKSTY